MTAPARIVGVVPAAGYASRLQPLAGSKEMVAVHGRPVVDFLLDGLRLGGCEEIRVVTRPEKRDLAEHARRRGASVILATTASVSESLLRALDDLADDDVVLTGFPDTVWEPADAFRQLRTRLTSPANVVLGLFEVEDDADCDRVRLDASGLVVGIDVKPRPPTSTLTWGSFAARAGTLRGLDRPEPGAYFHTLCGSAAVAGIRLSNRYLDIGTPAGLERVSSWLARSQDEVRT